MINITLYKGICILIELIYIITCNIRFQYDVNDVNRTKNKAYINDPLNSLWIQMLITKKEINMDYNYH